MSKNGAGSNNANKNDDDQPNKVEHPKAAINRLTKEILEQCRLLSTGQIESCYTLVEKTKELMVNENIVNPKDDE